METVLDVARTVGTTGGHLVAKIFVGAGFDPLLLAIRQSYRRVKMVKPESSRKESMEQYIVALQMK